MTTSAHPSRIPGSPTIVLIGPQGCGKTLFAKALAMKFSATHVISAATVNNVPVEDAATIPRDGALVIGDQPGGDLTLIAHTQAGFDALVAALGIPLSHRPPYSRESIRGPGTAFQWDTPDAPAQTDDALGAAADHLPA